LSELKVQNASGGVIYKNLLPVQTLTVTGFDHQTIPNSSSYEPEAIGLIAGLITLGKDALNVEAFTDSKALIRKLSQYKRKPSDEYVADHLIARLHELISQYHVDLTWVKGHPERRSKLKRKDWSRQDIGIYIADQMTQGGIDDLPPLRFRCDHIQPTIIQFRELLPEITRSTRYQYRRADNVPLAEYQMRKLQRQSTAEEYLKNREEASLEQRKIKWGDRNGPANFKTTDR
jgi:ribonuclease HI